MNKKEFFNPYRENWVHTWGEGPWIDEPDKVEFEYRDHLCQILRPTLPFAGHLCGYVRVSQDIVDIDSNMWEVHGGITFVINQKKYALQKEKKEKINPSEADLKPTPLVAKGRDPEEDWEGNWIGFDCGHWADLIPKQKDYEIRNLFGEFCEERTYRTVEFVTEELKRLVDQIVEYEERNE